MKKLTSLSIVFPAYNDEKAIGILVKKATRLLPQVSNTYEIIIVNDASTDDTGYVLEKLKKKISFLHVTHHKKNQGYGGALVAGFKKARYEFIFYTDGDGQYDVSEIEKLVAVMDGKTDMVTGFKLNRSDSWVRKAVGSAYNQFVKRVFGLQVRDIDCDFRLFRRSILQGVKLSVTSGAFDLEFIKKLEGKKVRIKEVPVHHYRRLYGTSEVFNLKNIVKSLIDVGKFWTSYEKKNTAH